MRRQQQPELHADQEQHAKPDRIDGAGDDRHEHRSVINIMLTDDKDARKIRSSIMPTRHCNDDSPAQARIPRLATNPIWFGVLFLICMQLGLLLPPHGLLLMTMRGVAPPEVTMAHIFRAVVPYVAMSLLLLALLLMFPMIATWLPNKLVG